MNWPILGWLTLAQAIDLVTWKALWRAVGNG
jgi:hypothetical protein